MVDDRMVDSFWDTLQNPLRGNPRKSIHKWWVFHVILHVWIDSNVHVQSVCLFKSSNPISLVLSKQRLDPHYKFLDQLKWDKDACSWWNAPFWSLCWQIDIWDPVGPHFADPWARLTSIKSSAFPFRKSAFLRTPTKNLANPQEVRRPRHAAAHVPWASAAGRPCGALWPDVAGAGSVLPRRRRCGGHAFFLAKRRNVGKRNY